MRRSTWRGSPARARGNRLFWWGVAGNLICCLMFTGLLVGFAAILLNS